MNRKDIIGIVLAAAVTGVISFVVALLLFSPPKHDAQVPVVQPISNSMPDITNDPNYNTIFNAKALDPTQPVKTGGNANNAPFKAGI